MASFRSEDCERLMEAYYEPEGPTGKIWLFLDEIQNVPTWEKWLNRLYEFEEVKIFVTGSNMSLMSSELSTALTGRKPPTGVVALFVPGVSCDKRGRDSRAGP